MARILGVGVATVDIINSLDQYPLEDQKLRINSRSIKRGGNAANSLVILSQLGHQCAFAGTLATDLLATMSTNNGAANNSDPIRTDFKKYNVDTSLCAISTTGSTPTSYITLSEKNGSRTIAHYRDLPEFSYNDFLNIDLTYFDWIHFEGRAIEETHKMLSYAKKNNPKTPLSLEIEKPRNNIESLFELSDTLFFSQTYATHLGFNDAESFIRQTQKKIPSKELICTWGRKESVATNKEGKLIQCQTYPPEKIVDTLAAGDTFNAGYIDAKLNNLTFSQTLDFANKLAGKKCGQLGLDFLT